MTTLLLVRHGRTIANAKRVLAGHTPGVALDDVGRQQAEALATRLADVKLAAIVTSPLERCQQTVAPLVAAGAPKPSVEEGLVECRYGAWTGQPLEELARDPMWARVQQYPSSVRFPGGESMAEMQARAVSAIHSWNVTVATEFGTDAVWLACSHEDVIKSIVSSLLGAPLDTFQRIVIANAAVTVVRFTESRPYLLRLNDAAGDLSQLVTG